MSDQVSGGGRAALVVTADHVYKEKNYHVSRCRKELESLQLCVDIFDLDSQPVELLKGYDVVEFIGGNPFYLLHSVRKSGAENVLRELADHKVLIGWSAAAFVFSPTLELLNCYSSEMNFIGLTDLRGLALTSVQVLPHYSKFLKRVDHFEDICREYEAAHDVAVIRINDGEGVVIDGENMIYCCESMDYK